MNTWPGKARDSRMENSGLQTPKYRGHDWGFTLFSLDFSSFSINSTAFKPAATAAITTIVIVMITIYFPQV